MKQRFYKTEWWKNTMTSLVGTVVGIVLTFGTTFYVEKKNKAEMAHQTVVITLHNLDAKIKNLKESTAWMNHIDTLFQAVLEHTPTDLDKMNPDTLLAAYDGFIYLDIRLSENVAESIFSNSIEVWEYMDDERIIGRISNCYMVSNYCTETQKELQTERLALFQEFLKTQKSIKRTPETARTFFQRPEVQFYLSKHAALTEFISSYSMRILTLMHNRNKKELGIQQEELDAAGNLLNEEDYKELDEL